MAALYPWHNCFGAPACSIAEAGLISLLKQIGGVHAGKAAREAALKSFWGILSPEAVGSRHALALAASAMRQVGVRVPSPCFAAHMLDASSSRCLLGSAI